jgi:hypothetical protein
LAEILQKKILIEISIKNNAIVNEKRELLFFLVLNNVSKKINDGTIKT